MAKTEDTKSQKTTTRTVRETDSPIANIQNSLEAAYQDLLKAQRDSARQLQNESSDAYTKYVEAVQDVAPDVNAHINLVRIEREFVQTQYDIQERYGERDKEAASAYEDAVKRIWSKVDVKDLDINTIAEASRIFWCFSYC